MQEILVESDHGSAFGYVAEVTDEQIQNFFINRDVVGAEPYIAQLKAQGRPVAFLCNIAVEEDARGNGEGSELMADFQERVSMLDADQIVLICDKPESQLEGFDLQTWYEDFGFRVIQLDGQSEEFPVMVLTMDTVC